MVGRRQGFDALNDIHKECLRLVAINHSSKEIARMLGISRHTVDQRLQFAKERLGASSRFEAARMFAQHEATLHDPTTYNQFIYQPSYLGQFESLDTTGPSAGVRDDRADAMATAAREVQAPYSATALADMGGPSFPSVSLDGRVVRRRNGITKLFWVLGITTGSMLVFSAAIAALEMLSRLQ